MSIPKKITVNCSKCGKPLSVTAFESINTNYANDIAEQIMSGKLFDVECPHCKFISHLEYDILYHDMRHSAMIWVVHPNSSDYEKKVEEVRSTQKLPYRTLRIVDDMNALKEKVSCLERNRDDRVIELCKVFIAYNALSQHPNFNFRNAFYSALSGKDMIYLYDDTDNELCCELPDKAYEYINGLYLNSHYATLFNPNYPIIDYAWAEKILITLVDAEAGKPESTLDGELAENSADGVAEENRLICPKCKSVLPNDSEFCQKCGAKLSTNTDHEDTAPVNIDGQLLFEAEIMEIRGDAPIVIKSAHLFCSDDREKLFLRCKFQSLSDNAISALMVDIECFDVWGNQLPTICDAQILDLNAKRDEEFGYLRKISIIDRNTRSVKVRLKRIRYTDGKIVECRGEEFRIPKAISLREYFDSTEMAKQYIHEVSKHASFVPEKLGAFWLCSCGQINTAEEYQCLQCRAEKQIVFDALNADFLVGRYAEYIEDQRLQEEHAQQEREKRQLAERQRQAELERQRTAQIQNERNAAILKRIAATEASNKKKRIVKIAAIAIVIAIIVVLVAQCSLESAHNNELRNFATEEMTSSYTNVYADVVSIEPEYFVYTTSGSTYGEITEVVCKCKTVENKTIWLVVFSWKYPGASTHREESFEPIYYSKSQPMRLVGRVTTAKQVIDKLANSIGNVFVLRVDEIPR